MPLNEPPGSDGGLADRGPAFFGTGAPLRLSLRAHARAHAECPADSGTPPRSRPGSVASPTPGTSISRQFPASAPDRPPPAFAGAGSAGRDTGYVALAPIDRGHQRPLGPAARLEQPLREVAILPELRDRHRKRAHPGLELPQPVTVAASEPGLAALPRYIGAPHRASASTPMRIWTSDLTISRKRSGSASSRCLQSHS